MAWAPENAENLFSLSTQLERNFENFPDRGEGKSDARFGTSDLQFIKGKVWDYLHALAVLSWTVTVTSHG